RSLGGRVDRGAPGRASPGPAGPGPGHAVTMVPPGTAAAGGSPPPSVRRNENHNGVLPAGDDGTSAGPVRVDLRFEPSGRQVRVPAGVSVFDAAGWNGIAIDSTCGGHGTCKKCKVRMLDGG